jgi:hypothetical protein
MMTVVGVELPGDPQKSVSNRVELNLVLKPKSHNLRFTHFPVSLSKVRRMFSGFKSRMWTWQEGGEEGINNLKERSVYIMNQTFSTE